MQYIFHFYIFLICFQTLIMIDYVSFFCYSCLCSCKKCNTKMWLSRLNGFMKPWTCCGSTSRPSGHSTEKRLSGFIFACLSTRPSTNPETELSLNLLDGHSNASLSMHQCKSLRKHSTRLETEENGNKGGKKVTNFNEVLQDWMATEKKENCF